MKAILKILIALMILSCNLFAQWYTQVSGTTNTFKSVYFINENTGFIIGENLILSSTNAGINWNNSILQGRNNDILFVNSNTGFICSDSGKIHKTTNAGTTWNLINAGTFNNLMRISFLNENTGIATGFNRTILKTTNSGINWVNTITNIDTLNFLGCKIINENNYIISGTSSTIYRSTNSGTSWIASTMGFVNPFWEPAFINDNTGWIIGCCGMFIKTTDSGVNWSPEIYLTLGYTLYTMKFINSTTGYVCGDNGILYRTTNQGNSWDSTVTGTNEILYSLFMVNENTGWAVGNYGTLLKTTNGGGTGYTIGIQPISNEIPNKFSLSQNYPNPFNPVTKIKFQIPKSSNTKITIFDILGKEVMTLVDEKVNPGTYEFNFDGSKLASGIYFYNLTADNYIITKKMILVK